ncbi:MAG: tetratricopeptide repeat protein [Myxococcota bacterium]|jgi:hypothetical protein
MISTKGKRNRRYPIEWVVAQILIIAFCAELTGCNDQIKCFCGQNKACLKLGDCYAKSECGLVKDELKAEKMYLKVCEGNDVEGCNKLGQCYLKNECGSGKDWLKAPKYFQKACDGGHLLGCLNLGDCYLKGNCGLFRNGEKAAEYFKKACDGGEMGGCAKLGECYFAGECGQGSDDPKTIVELLSKACDGGAMRGCHLLGVRYLFGGWVVDKNMQRAEDLFRKACDGGYKLGCQFHQTFFQKEPIRGEIMPILSRPSDTKVDMDSSKTERDGGSKVGGVNHTN